MIATTTALVRSDGRLGALHCEPPLTLRRVYAEDAGTCALCLVGTAAGPLAGDDLTLRLRLDHDARATLQATGASIAQGRSGAPGTVRWIADVGAGATLRADPGALVICAGSRVDVTVSITLGVDAVLEWRELVVLGRSADPQPGTGSLRWDVTRAGRPVLRQRIELTGRPLSMGNTAGPRVLASALLSGPDVAARTVVASASAVAAQVDEHTMLVTVLAAGAVAARAQLDELSAEARTPPVRAGAD